MCSSSFSFAEIRHFTTSDGVDLFVEISGKGTPCLLVHGGPGSGTYWIKKFSGEMLERHFKMVYVDQRGAGRSSSPKDDNYTMDRIVKDFEEVREALGIREWITLGHSFGGILQMGYQQRFPMSVRGMIMVNTVLNMTEGLDHAIPKACEFLGSSAPEECHNRKIPVTQQLMVVYQKLRERDLFWKMGYTSKASEDAVTAAMQESPYNHGEENSIMSVKEYFADFKGATAKVMAPVLFFSGKNRLDGWAE